MINRICCRVKNVCLWYNLLAKHQLKSNVVDQLLSPEHSDDEWLYNDRTVHILPTPGNYFDFIFDF